MHQPLAVSCKPSAVDAKTRCYTIKHPITPFDFFMSGNVMRIGVWSAAARRRFPRRDMSRHPKVQMCLRSPNLGKNPSLNNTYRHIRTRIDTSSFFAGINVTQIGCRVGPLARYSRRRRDATTQQAVDAAPKYPDQPGLTRKNPDQPTSSFFMGHCEPGQTLGFGLWALDGSHPRKSLISRISERISRAGRVFRHLTCPRALPRLGPLSLWTHWKF
jgi:hypothetical protein